MPSPLGHAIAGVAVGWFIAPPEPPDERRATAAAVALYGAAGVVPDLDLAFGMHSGPTHGLGAAVIVGALIMLTIRRLLPRRRAQAWLPVGLAVAGAYASHTLLDWLGTDTSAPVGIMALWPFSRTYYESSLHVFMAISRRYWLPGFWTHNLSALARELLVLAPLLVIVVAGKRRGGVANSVTS
jgi:inner membrane protein